MAEKLKRQYDIIVLKTELLDRAGDEPDVRFTLQHKIEGRLEDVRTWAGHTREMGLHEAVDSRKVASGAEPFIVLPGNLLDELDAWFRQETEGDRPLWVHLVKPYGALRLVPWERLLGSVLQVPILMLPDFIFPRPREAPATLDVVLCGSAPLSNEGYSGYRSLAQTARRIIEGSPRRTKLHIFVDAQFADALREEWDATGKLGNEVLVYDNAVAERYVEEGPTSRLVDRTDVLRSPWLMWMREALRGRAVDVVHFCCHGYLSRGRGALLFAQSPLGRSDRYLAWPVSAVELQTFLTQVGAWSSVFTSVPDNFSEMGLRSLADQIAQNRPGPMMLHNMRFDPDAGALAAGYHFLYSNTPETPPRSISLFIYCQPYLSPDASTQQTQAAPAPAASQRSGPKFAVPESEPQSAGPRRHRGYAPAPEGPSFEETFALPGFEPQETALSPSAAESRGRVGLEELARNSMQQEQAERSSAASALDPLFQGEENVPTWIASTERFAEQVQLRYQELARDNLLPEGTRESQTNLAMKTIDSLRKAVFEQASKMPEKGGAQ